VYDLLELPTGIKLRAVDQEVRSLFLLESGWISKRQSVRFAVAFVLHEDFVNRRLSFDVLARGRVAPLIKVRSYSIKR
jgi:hypothetical protein